MKFLYSVLFTLALGHSTLALADVDSESWPRQFTSGNQQFTVYQPQVESWQGTRLEERAAVSVVTQAAAEPVFGVVWLSARTDIDKSQRLVALEDLQITKLNFPTESATQIKTALQDILPQVLGTISLDRLRASLTIGNVEAKRKVDIKNDVPAVFYSATPAVLVLVDGEPVLRDTGVSDLKRVVNTRALIAFNSANGKYYLNTAGYWYQAEKATGPWQVSQPSINLKSDLNQVASEADTAKLTDATESTSDKAPAIFVSEKSAELIQTQGAPQFQSIPKTELLYVTNTPDNLFMYTADQGYYVTLSGRWFRSNSLKGPWRFVPADRLPKDFANIPENHPKGEILASVPGTPDAQEAVIANEIPQTATVDRSAAKLHVVYDGDPKFGPISGSRLQYALNSGTPVIRDANGQYYAVENGVWFTSTSPVGPWVVASEVPTDIYSIPPSSPVYYVTYVYVYGADPHYVYVGYLPGYLGSYATPNGVVVYGTGYYYRPWIGRHWYGYPVTYGYGLSWGFGFGWTFRPVFYGAPVYHPWWGPWPHYWAYNRHPVMGAGWTVNHLNVYHTWDRGVLRATTPHMAPMPVRINTPIMRGSNQHAVSGPVMHNNVYADHSGAVYRHNNNVWEKYGGGAGAAGTHTSPAVHTNWQQAPHSAPLEAERSARARGEVRTQRYRVTVPARPAPARGKRK